MNLGMVIDWERKITSETYGSSCLSSDFLIVASYTTTSYITTHFNVFWTESGEIYTPISLLTSKPTLIYSQTNKNVKAISIASSGEGGIYILVKYSNKPETISTNTYKLDLVEFSTSPSKSITLEVIASRALPGEVLTDEARDSFNTYPPTHIFLYYPLGDYDIPGVLLVSHLNRDEHNGLLLYGFSRTDSTNLLAYSYNPFAVEVVNDKCKYKVIGTNKCLKCGMFLMSQYILASPFTCGMSCSTNYFLQSGTDKCTVCHLSCNQCSGPLRNQCTACGSNAVYSMTLAQCICKGSYCFSSGSCAFICGTLSSYKFKAIRANAPKYTFDLANKFKNIFMSTATPDETAYIYKLTKCSHLPLPPRPSGMPNEFFLGLWVYQSSPDDNSIILSGLSNLAIRVIKSAVQGIKFTTTNGYSTITQQLTTNWDTASWKYIAISIKNELLSYYLTVYTYTETSTNVIYSNAYTKKGFTTINYEIYDPNIYLGCTATTITTEKLNGYVRELVYILRYYDKDDMEVVKSIAYNSNLQVYKQLVSYWKFDKTLNGHFVDKINDYQSIDVDPLVVDVSSTSLLASFVKGRNCESKLGIIGSSFDLFSYSDFPKFSFDTMDFAANELEPKINLNSFVTLSGVIQVGDYISFHFNGCSGKKVTDVNVKLSISLKVILERNKPLLNVRGKFIDSCYCDSNSNCILLGRTYFPLLPSRVNPAHGVSDIGSTVPLKFELGGGDQSYGDKLILMRMDMEVLSATKERILIDEKSLNQVYSVTKRIINSYDSFSTSILDRGLYVLAWRPSYLTYLTDESNYIYKNLFITWTMQEAPKVNFPPLSGVPNAYKNTMAHKKEFFYLELSGSGQADGDQVIFCQARCGYSNGYRLSRVFQRENGRYSPIWLGKVEGGFGVWGITDSTPSIQKLLICWRPAARAITIPPQEDQWIALEDSKQSGIKAFLSITEINTVNPEIAEINLNMKHNDDGSITVLAPTLYEGNIIWFLLKTGSGESQIAFSTGGKVEIAHVTYDTYYKDSYTLETIWLGLSTSSTGNIVNDNGKFTLQNIPYEKMLPGHDYMLIIYGGTFYHFDGGSYRWLSGVGDVTPQLRYLFRYQESSFKDPVFAYMAPGIKDFVIMGTNFGTTRVPGNLYLEVRKLFGVVVKVTANPPCDNEIKAGYIQGTLDDNPTEIVLKSIDLSSCSTQHKLTLDLKLLKLSDDFSEYPIWSTINMSKTLTIGSVGCDSSCKTCNGETSLDCLSCYGDGSYPYLYKTQCLSKCPITSKYSYLIFQPSSYIISYYECTDKCQSGYYLDEQFNICMRCNYQCATCTSGKIESCTSCKGTYTAHSSIDYLNKFSDGYSFRGMCLYDCPIILRDDLDPTSNVILSNVYEHRCSVDESKMIPVYFDVTIQRLIYEERVDSKRSLNLRALFDDHRTFTTNTEALIPTFLWSSYPDEDKTIEDFFNSDKRVFQNYTEENLNRGITELNANAFNYRSDNNHVRVVVRAWANGAFNFDMTEIYGNKPPELDDNKVTFKFNDELLIDKNLTSFDELQTMRRISINISDILDADDYYPIMNFKVLLVPRSLALKNLPKNLSVSVADLELLAQLQGDYMIIYNNKATVLDNKLAILDNIYIPPLINGSQMISESDDVTSKTIKCDLIIYVEDRHSGITTAKFTFEVKEMYEPEDKMNTLEKLHNEMLIKNNHNSLTWDDALNIAHTLRVITPEFKNYYMSYNQCARDDQCNNGGRCITSGGWSQCACDTPYIGISCNWILKELSIEEDLARMIINFLNTTMLIHVKDLEAMNINDTNKIDQLANIFIGLLKNPEIVSKDYLSCIINLTHYMTRIDYTIGGRMETFEKTNVYKAMDLIVKYVYYHLREDIYKYYTFSEDKGSSYNTQKENYLIMRNELFDIIKVTRDSLYRFVDATTIIQYPGDLPYTFESDSFEIFMASVTEDQMFGSLGDYLSIQLRSEQGNIKLPISMFKLTRKDVSVNEEFKIRIVKWKENPYIFSDFHSEVCTPVFSFAVLNSNSTPISIKTNDPIVFFMPISEFTKNFPTDPIRCMNFNDLHKTTMEVYKSHQINVNDLALTNEEKMRLYPEWNADYYHSKNLVIDVEEYTKEEINYPEFEDLQGISSYGNILSPDEYLGVITCAVYSNGEIAGISQRKTSHQRGDQTLNFYYDYDSMNTKYVNVCLYACIIVGIMFIISIGIAFALDIICLPMHSKMILLHRPEYSEEKPLLESCATGKRLNERITGNNNLSDCREENIKPEETIKPSVNSSEKIDKKSHKATKTSVKFKKTSTIITENTTVMKREKRLSIAENTLESPNGKGFNSQSLLKEPNDTTNITQEPAATQDLIGTSITLENHGSQKTADKKVNIKASRSKAKPTKISKKKEVVISTSNIFSKEHLKKRESEQFKFLNIFVYSNITLNTIIRSNTIFTRPERCFIIYSYIYLMMICSALLITTRNKELDHPEYFKDIQFISNKNILIILLTPIIASILLYFIAAIYKVDESRIMETKTSRRYKDTL